MYASRRAKFENSDVCRVVSLSVTQQIKRPCSKTSRVKRVSRQLSSLYQKFGSIRAECSALGSDDISKMRKLFDHINPTTSRVYWTDYLLVSEVEVENRIPSSEVPSDRTSTFCLVAFVTSNSVVLTIPPSLPVSGLSCNGNVLVPPSSSY